MSYIEDISSFYHQVERQIIGFFKESKQGSLDAESFVDIFYIIVEQMCNICKNTGQKINVKITNMIGIVLFNDRFLIHNELFSKFLRFDQSIIDSIVFSPELKAQALSQPEFENMIGWGYIRGSKYDWHLCNYPFCEKSTLLMMTLSDKDLGCSYYIASKKFMYDKVSLNKKKPKLEIKSFVLVSEKPSPSLNVVSKSLDEITSFFCDKTPQKGKCWLLYK